MMDDVIRVQGKQLEMLLWADEHGEQLPINIHARTLDALVTKGLVETRKGKSGLWLSDKGQQVVNRHKLNTATVQEQEINFLSLWQQYGDAGLEYIHDTPATRELVKIVPGRGYRFDVVFPSVRVAVEIQGATGRGTAGGHTSFTGYKRDVLKMSAALAAGWIVVPITTQMLDEAVDDFAPGEHAIRRLVEIIRLRWRYGFLGLLEQSDYVTLGQSIQFFRKPPGEHFGNLIATISRYSPDFAVITNHVLDYWDVDFFHQRYISEETPCAAFKKPADTLGAMYRTRQARRELYRRRVGDIPDATDD